MYCLFYTHIGRLKQPSRLWGRAEALARVDCLRPQLLLNTQQLIVLCQALGPAWRARLDLLGAQAHCQVSNEGVLRLPAAVGGHDAPPRRLRVQHGADGLCHAANLVDLEEQGIGGLLGDGRGNALGVGDQQVIPHNLHVLAHGGSDGLPVAPVILQGESVGGG